MRSAPGPPSGRAAVEAGSLPRGRGTAPAVAASWKPRSACRSPRFAASTTCARRPATSGRRSPQGWTPRSSSGPACWGAQLQFRGQRTSSGRPPFPWLETLRCRRRGQVLSFARPRSGSLRIGFPGARWHVTPGGGGAAREPAGRRVPRRRRSRRGGGAREPIPRMTGHDRTFSVVRLQSPPSRKRSVTRSCTGPG